LNMAENSGLSCWLERLAYPRRTTGWIILAFLLPFLHSCMPGRQTARGFIKSPPGISILVNAPDLVYKFNHRGEDIRGFDSMSQSRQDSALWVSSRYMQFLNDSILLENYMNRFISELRLLGFTVYVGSADDSLLKANPQSYVVDIAQLQMDEYNYTLEDEDAFLDSVYLKKIRLNAVDFSAWFDLWKVSSGPGRKTTLYGTSTAYDDFDGKFFNDPFSGSVRYKYSIDTLKVADMYEMATVLGKKHAGYLYDFFLNQYVAIHLPEGEEPEDYYHYDRARHYLTPAGDDRLEILEPK